LASRDGQLERAPKRLLRPSCDAVATSREVQRLLLVGRAGTTHFREQMPYGLFVPMVREEQSLLFSICPACRRVRTCTEREQPRRKIVRTGKQPARQDRIQRSGAWLATACRANGVDGASERGQKGRKLSPGTSAAPMCCQAEPCSKNSTSKRPGGFPRPRL
jgi:hypothetical protein